MELEFDREVLHCYQVLSTKTINQEETMESIVPDACPDIQEIMGVYGQAFLEQKQGEEGGATLSGTVHTTVLYRPEEGQGLKKLTVKLPFTIRLDEGGRQCVIQGRVWVKCASANILNPRKILLRVELAGCVMLLQPVKQVLCQGVLEPERWNIEEKKTECESYQLCVAQEKPFSFSEQIRTNGTGEEELLWWKAKPQCSECKRIGNKLIFKGNVEVELLLQQNEGELTTHQENLPFSQVMELAEAGDSGDCQVMVELKSMDCVQGDGHGWEVSLELVAQGQVWQPQSFALLQDLYSTTHETKVQMEHCSLLQRMEQPEQTISLRELVETEEMPRTVLEQWVTVGETTRRQDGDGLKLESKAYVTVLYLDEAGTLHVVEKTFPLSCQLELGADVSHLTWGIWPGEVYVSPAVGGLEVRCTFEVPCLCLKEQDIAWVSGATLGEERQKKTGRQPSMVLRLASPEESLWDLAKTYGTTMQQIAAANQLEGEQLPLGSMLLIPAIR